MKIDLTKKRDVILRLYELKKTFNTQFRPAITGEGKKLWNELIQLQEICQKKGW
jgi:hypothetical protein